MPRDDDVLVPHGGLSGAPEDRRHDLASDLWTNPPLRDDYQTAAVHRTYYLAGAAVATTASYQTSDDLLGARVRIAREVRDEAHEEREVPAPDELETTAHAATCAVPLVRLSAAYDSQALALPGRVEHEDMAGLLGQLSPRINRGDVHSPE